MDHPVEGRMDDHWRMEIHLNLQSSTCIWAVDIVEATRKHAKLRTFTLEPEEMIAMNMDCEAKLSSLIANDVTDPWVAITESYDYLTLDGKIGRTRPGLDVDGLRAIRLYLKPEPESFPYVEFHESFCEVSNAFGMDYHRFLFEYNDLKFATPIRLVTFLEHEHPPHEMVTQLFSLDYHAAGCISPVSFLMHVSRAVPINPAFDRRNPGKHGSGVLVDGAGGTRLALDYLIGIGHNKIVYMNPPSMKRFRSFSEAHYSAMQRHEAYVRILPERNLPVIGGHEEALTAQEILQRKLIDEGITAVLCYSAGEARALLAEAIKREVPVPGRLSIIAFNDLPPVFDYWSGISAISLPARQMGETAADMLIDVMHSGSKSLRVLEEELVIRETTAPPAGVH